MLGVHNDAGPLPGQNPPVVRMGKIDWGGLHELNRTDRISPVDRLARQGFDAAIVIMASIDHVSDSQIEAFNSRRSSFALDMHLRGLLTVFSLIADPGRVFNNELSAPLPNAEWPS